MNGATLSLGTVMRPESADESHQELMDLLSRMEQVTSEIMVVCMADGTIDPHVRLRAEMNYHRVQALSIVVAEIANDLTVAHIEKWLAKPQAAKDLSRARRKSQRS